MSSEYTLQTHNDYRLFSETWSKLDTETKQPPRYHPKDDDHHDADEDYESDIVVQGSDVEMSDNDD